MIQGLPVMQCDEKRSISDLLLQPVGRAMNLMISSYEALHGVDVTLQRQRDCHVKGQPMAMSSDAFRWSERKAQTSPPLLCCIGITFCASAVESRSNFDCKTPCNMQCSMMRYVMQMQRLASCFAPRIVGEIIVRVRVFPH